MAEAINDAAPAIEEKGVTSWQSSSPLVLHLFYIPSGSWGKLSDILSGTLSNQSRSNNTLAYTVMNGIC